ncbi:MAG TPA: VWA domain-containing protein [bacterium]|nr:VWA domain-containing protein [bacterium]
MKKALLVVLSVLAAASVALAPKKIAVLYFDVAAPTNDYDYLATGIPEMLITDLANQRDITVIERERLDEVLQEMALGGSGITDNATALEVGKILNVELLIMGNLTVAGESFRLDTKILEVETAEVIGAVKAATEDEGDLFDLVDATSAALIDKLRGVTLGSGLTYDIPEGAVRFDVAFVIDTTGSMGDEIQVVKEKMKEIAAEVAQGTPPPAVRFGIVEYRDRGDVYVTQTTDLTYDVARLNERINSIIASGGGDAPESVAEGLRAAIHELSWETGPVVRLAFVIGDAADHLYGDAGYTLQDAAEDAADLGLTFFTIGCSGLDPAGESQFVKLAYETNGSFEYLTYRQRYIDDTGKEVALLYEGDHVYEEPTLTEPSLTASIDYAYPAESEEVGGVGSSGIITSALKGEGYGAGGSGSYDEYYTEATGAEAEYLASEETVMSVSGGSTVGAKENNLDRLVTDVIMAEAIRRDVSYDLGIPVAKVLVENSGRRAWLPVTDPTMMDRLRSAAGAGETLWVSAGVSPKPEGSAAENAFVFVAGTLRLFDKESQVPAMARGDFAVFDGDPAYYRDHGLGSPNVWAVPVRVLEFEAVEPAE